MMGWQITDYRAANVPFVFGGQQQPYAGTQGLTFRHPYSKRSNFLCIDNHIETLTPRDNVCDPKRYGMPY